MLCTFFGALRNIDTRISFFVKHCANRTSTPAGTQCNADFVRLFTCTSARNTRVDTVIVLLSLYWTLCRVCVYITVK